MKLFGKRSFYLILPIILTCLLAIIVRERIFINFFFIYLFGLTVYIFKNNISRFLNVPINTQLIPLARVLYAIICIYTAVQNVTMIESQLEPSNFDYLNIEHSTTLAYLLSFVYILSLVCIGIGYRVRFFFFLTFILAGLLIPFSLETFTKNTFNFFAIFIPSYAWLGKKNPNPNNSDGWPILLMVISYCFLTFVAGLSKLLDPVWQEGLGLYYSLNIPFFTPKYLWFLLDNRFLMELFNWMTIIVEMIGLPLVFFRRTRIISYISLIMLGLFLSFIMGHIGLVGGPIILIACVLALSLTSFPNKLGGVERYIRFSFLTVSIKPSSTKSGLTSLIVFGITFLCITSQSIDLFLTTYNYKAAPRFGEYTVHSDKYVSEDSNIYKGLNLFKNSLRKLEPRKEWQIVWGLSLFDYYHLFDRLYFRVVYKDNKGKIYQYRKYFNEDGSLADEYPLPSNERFFFIGYRIMEVVTSEGFHESGYIPDYVKNDMRSIVKYSNPDKLDYDIAEVQVKHVYQPYRYNGNDKLWENHEWTTFYRVHNNTNKEEFLDSIKTYDYSKLEIEKFRNKIITPNY